MNFKEMTIEQLLGLRSSIDRELKLRSDEIFVCQKNKSKKAGSKVDPYKEQVALIREVAREIGGKIKSEPIFYRDKRKEGIRVKVVYDISNEKLKEKAYKELTERVVRLHLSNLTDIKEKDSISYAYGYPRKIHFIGFFFI